MKFLTFDIESNGLHGEAFSVAALLMSQTPASVKGPRILSEFMGRCPIKGPVDTWVQDNVLPPMTGIPENYATPKLMRDGFWAWYTGAKARADFVLVNNPYPVEARFLLACQEDDPAVRYEHHPFPLIDLASLQLTLGLMTRPQRQAFMKEVIGDTENLSHNPRWDAWVTGLAAFEVLRRTGQL